MPRRPAGLLALVLALALPASASAQQDFLTVFKAYQKAGKIDACKFSAKTLREAKEQVPNDFDQYSPDFEAALDAALSQRAAGKCKKGSPGEGTAGGPAGPATTTPATPGAAAPTTTPAQTAPAQPTTTPGAAPQPDPSLQPAPAASDDAIPAAAAADGSSDDAPAPLLVLAILGGLILLTAALLAALRAAGWEPAWWVRARHATGEAGWRAGNAWSEFTDWVKLGR